jgi:formate dehydrogenase subunit delta
VSAELTAKLVMMANQIATAFEGQGGDAVRETAAHIRAFWSPPMRQALTHDLALVEASLTPTARAALQALAAAPAPVRSAPA